MVSAIVRNLIVIANMDCRILAQLKSSIRRKPTAEASGFNIAVTPEQESTKNWLGQDVQDTVEHSFRVGRDDIATFRKSPSYRVEEPEEGGPSADDEVSSRDIRPNRRRVLAAGPDESPRNPKESEASEDVVSPLYFH